MVPVAQFVSSANYLTVSFTDTSLNSPTSWAWDFGDGSPVNNSQNPIHTYSAPGLYAVTLTATNADGSSSITINLSIGIPQANFTFSPTLLVVIFTDTSTNFPVAWEWDFGDGNTSTNQNPTHTYATPGIYTVSLKAINAGGFTVKSRTIQVSDSPILPLPLREFILYRLPQGIDFDPELIDALIAKWQMYLAPLVTPPVNIDNVFYESSYPPLVNVLIASLVVYELLIDTANNLMLSLASTSGGQSSGSGSSSTSGSTGGIKKIVTGPTEVEFHNPAEILRNYFKQSNSSSNRIGQGNSPMDGIKNDICMLAQRLGIWLPICPPISAPVLAPLITSPTQESIGETSNYYGWVASKACAWVDYALYGFRCM
jgi:PKD repeat protein